jgi:hypothetical protein
MEGRQMNFLGKVLSVTEWMFAVIVAISISSMGILIMGWLLAIIEQKILRQRRRREGSNSVRRFRNSTPTADSDNK